MQLLQMQLSSLKDLADLTPEQRDLILNGDNSGGKRISMLSKFANIHRKDYVEYNQAQIQVYNLLHGRNDSQKRIEKLREKRMDHERQRDEGY